MLATAAHVVGAWFAAVFAFWKGHYFVPGAAFALGLGVVLLVPLVLIAMARIEEIAAIAFGRKPRRLLQVASPPLAPERAGYAPKVSIHIPAYQAKQPEMLKATLDAVAGLNYPNFECIVIINNTPDPAYWQPVEEHCATLGERFKFLREDKVEGFKAGALRIALEQTAPDAEIIGIIDADYIVAPSWLTDLVPVFADPKVGLVQAPQDHRDGDRSVMHYAMDGEYSGFFDIGMVERNEKNAIIVHGTMCLMRREALAAAGNWSSDTICEDTDLGLTMIELGWKTHYTNRRYGFGLLPDTFGAYKKQRHRWAYGGAQIVKKHWRRFLPGVSSLNREQKRAFLLGWLNWLGAEALGVVVAIMNLLWVPVVAFVGIAIPDKILTIPILAAFAVSVAAFRRAVPAARRDPEEADVRRDVCGDVAAAHGGARGGRRPDQGSPALQPHRQGQPRPQAAAVRRLLGADPRLAADHRRDHAGRDQPAADHRDLHLRVRAGGAEPAVPVGRGAGRLEGRRVNDFAFWTALQPQARDRASPQPGASQRRRPRPSPMRSPRCQAAAPVEKQPETVQ